jgi:hypothetical protein
VVFGFYVASIKPNTFISSVMLGYKSSVISSYIQFHYKWLECIN